MIDVFARNEKNGSGVSIDEAREIQVKVQWRIEADHPIHRAGVFAPAFFRHVGVDSLEAGANFPDEKRRRIAACSCGRSPPNPSPHNTSKPVSPGQNRIPFRQLGRTLFAASQYFVKPR